VCVYIYIYKYREEEAVETIGLTREIKMYIQRGGRRWIAVCIYIYIYNYREEELTPRYLLDREAVERLESQHLVEHLDRRLWRRWVDLAQGRGQDRRERA